MGDREQGTPAVSGKAADLVDIGRSSVRGGTGKGMIFMHEEDENDNVDI